MALFVSQFESVVCAIARSFLVDLSRKKVGMQGRLLGGLLFSLSGGERQVGSQVVTRCARHCQKARVLGLRHYLRGMAGRRARAGDMHEPVDLRRAPLRQGISSCYSCVSSQAHAGRRAMEPSASLQRHPCWNPYQGGGHNDSRRRFHAEVFISAV